MSDFFIAPANKIGASNYYGVVEPPSPAEAATTTTPEPPSKSVPPGNRFGRPPAPKSKRSNPFVLGFVGSLVLVLLAVVLLAPLAPHTVNSPVDPSVITSYPDTSKTCEYDGGVIAATLTDNSGRANVYSVTCSDGLVTSVGQPR